MATKPKQMAFVSVGFGCELLMPADQAMQLGKLLQAAVSCRRRYADREYEYHVGDQPEFELALVKPSQIKFPEGTQPQPAAKRTARIGHEPLKLE